LSLPFLSWRRSHQRFFYEKVILDGERDDGPNAGEGVRHHGNDGPVAQTYDG